MGPSPLSDGNIKEPRQDARGGIVLQWARRLAATGTARVLSVRAGSGSASMGPSPLSDGNLRLLFATALPVEASMGPSPLSDGNDHAGVQDRVDLALQWGRRLS